MLSMYYKVFFLVIYSKGEHYWMTDFQMNCDETESGWFELKMLVSNYGANGGWECKHL